MAAIGTSRRSFEHWLRTAGIEGGACEELAVVFSELVSNAARAATETDDVARIEAWTEAGGVVLQVSNRVPDGQAPMVHWDLDDPLRPGGRGLMIVRAYTDDLSVTATDQRLTVRCRRHLA